MRGRRITAIVVSVLLPGAGHVALGHVRRGLFWFLLGLAFVPLIATPAVAIAGIAAGFLRHIGAAVDVARLPISPSVPPRWPRVIVWWLGLFLLTLATGFVVRTFVVKAYRIPSNAMYPAIEVGDNIMVNKFLYRFRDPARGDVIVFKYPVDESRDFIKRIVAVGGETVYMKGRRVYIDCVPPAPTCRPIEDPWAYYEERMGLGDETYGPQAIPQGSYFVLGDNRHNSQDSRYWGVVRREKIRGKAFIVYWSWDSSTRDKSLWERARWERIGRRLD